MAVCHRRVLAGLSLAVLTAAILTACSEEEPGDPNPGGPPTDTGQATSASPTGTGADGANGAPRVADPLDASAIEQNPCTALPDATAETLNLHPGKQDALSTGEQYCEYEYNDDSGSRVNIKYESTFANGLGDVYARKGELGHFEPTEIAAYPAVFADRVEPREGTCQLLVGLSDTSVVNVFTQLTQSTSDYPQGCAVAEKTTETMIENLKGRA